MGHFFEIGVKLNRPGFHGQLIKPHGLLPALVERLNIVGDIRFGSSWNSGWRDPEIAMRQTNPRFHHLVGVKIP